MNSFFTRLAFSLFVILLNVGSIQPLISQPSLSSFQGNSSLYTTVIPKQHQTNVAKNEDRLPLKPAVQQTLTGVLDLFFPGGPGLIIIQGTEMFVADDTKFYDKSGNEIPDSLFQMGMIVKSIFNDGFGDNRLISMQIVDETTRSSYTGLLTSITSYSLGVDDTMSVSYSNYFTKIFDLSGKRIEFPDTSSFELGYAIRAAGIRTSYGVSANDYGDSIFIISDGVGYEAIITDYITDVQGNTLTIAGKTVTLPDNLRVTLGKERSLPLSALMPEEYIQVIATKESNNTYTAKFIQLGSFLGLLPVQEVTDDALIADDYPFPLLQDTKFYFSDGTPATKSDVTNGSFCALFSIQPDFTDISKFYRLGVVVIEQADFKFVLRGLVEDITDSTLTVHGIAVETNSATKIYKGVLQKEVSFNSIKKSIYVEMLVQRIFADQQYIATEIYIEDDITEARFEFGGVVDSLNLDTRIITISGVQFEATEQTILTDIDYNNRKFVDYMADIKPKSFASVTGRTTDDGRNIAEVIKIIEGSFLEYTVSGPVTAKTTTSISIGTLTLDVNSETQFENASNLSGLQVGNFIHVLYHFMPDRTKKAIRIAKADDNSAQYVHLVGRIDSIDVNGFTASGLHFTVMDSTEFTNERGEIVNFSDLKLGASVVVEGAWSAGTDITAYFVMMRQVVFLRAVFRSSTKQTAVIGNQEYLIDSTTTIFDADGKSIKISDIPPGSTVEVTASSQTSSDGKVTRTAERIQIQKKAVVGIIEHDYSAQTKLSATPNPTQSTSTIRFEIPRTSAVELSVFSLSGAMISTIYNGTIPIGMHEFQWNSTGLPMGEYFVRLQTKSGVSIIPLSVVR
ncbi:MAG: T9SS type A sorting domain-containing protein [Ignavibacteria bacterium]|nr:T9SS type A sorting domain-containing protein [Ignavibacteria bacterium]